MSTRSWLGRSIALLLSLLVCRPASAEIMPRFDLNTCAGCAKYVVLGTLDARGDLRIKSLLKGKGLEARVRLGDGDTFHALRKTMGLVAAKEIEVVAFLSAMRRSAWVSVSQWAGVVGIGDDGVYMHRAALVPGGARLERHPEHTRASFLLAVKSAVAAAEERDRLLASPRSLGRTRQLVSFLLEHEQVLEGGHSLFAWRARYHLTQLANGLRPASPDEETAVLEALESADGAVERELLIDLIGAVPMTARSFEQVAAFLDRRYPAGVRRAGVRALASIDGYRAAGRLAPYLSLDEPQLWTFLGGLGTRSFPPQDPRLNPAVIKPLVELASDVRRRQLIEGPYVLTNEWSVLLCQLAHYGHPRLVEVLYEWAMADEETSVGALGGLWSVTGLKFTREEKDQWQAWWVKAGPVLAKVFDLQTEDGRVSWLETYHGADDATGRVLMNLWLFEPEVDEGELLEHASGQDAARAEAAKAVLSELWQRHRLSASTRKAIIERFLTARLVELPNDRPEPDWRWVQLIVDRRFPFRRKPQIHARRGFTIGGSEPTLRHNAGIRSFEGTGPLVIWKCWGRHLGRPVAKAVLELWEVDRLAGGKVIWRARLSPPPIRLEDRRKD